MKTLLELQQHFARETSQLLIYIHSQGYEVTLGDAYRDPRLHGDIGIKKGYGHPKSCHKLKLAIDLNLYKDGKWLKDTKDHAKIGAWWKARSPLHAWGGDFDDGNHYSLTYKGMK